MSSTAQPSSQSTLSAAASLPDTLRQLTAALGETGRARTEAATKLDEWDLMLASEAFAAFVAIRASADREEGRIDHANLVLAALGANRGIKRLDQLPTRLVQAAAPGADKSLLPRAVRGLQAEGVAPADAKAYLQQHGLRATADKAAGIGGKPSTEQKRVERAQAAHAAVAAAPALADLGAVDLGAVDLGTADAPALLLLFPDGTVRGRVDDAKLVERAVAFVAKTLG